MSAPVDLAREGVSYGHARNPSDCRSIPAPTRKNILDEPLVEDPFAPLPRRPGSFCRPGG
jgi:hypothetical protein